jgi:hypothetical protein
MTILETYRSEYYKYLINVVIFSLFVTALCLTLAALYKADIVTQLSIVASCIGVVLVAYFLGMLWVFHTIRKRTRYDWNQLIFEPSKSIKEAQRASDGGSSR